MPDKTEDVVLTIGNSGYTQVQASTMAFNTYRMSHEILDAGLLTWIRLTKLSDFSLKDYAFLILYFLDVVATPDIQELYKEKIHSIKRELK